jgi:hypothetical protein
MKKSLFAAFIIAAVAVFAVMMGIGNINADSEIGQTPIDWDLMAYADQEPVPMGSDCATIKCGDCPGPKCIIDGICCWRHDTNQPGLASCGCGADGKSYCKCETGVPR